MSVERDEGSGVTIVRFEGRLDTNTSADAQSRLDAVLDQGAEKLLVDLGAVDYISSVGLRVFLSAAKRIRQSGGALRFCHLNPTVADVFDIAGFSKIFQVFPSRAEAMQTF